MQNFISKLRLTCLHQNPVPIELCGAVVHLPLPVLQIGEDERDAGVSPLLENVPLEIERGALGCLQTLLAAVEHAAVGVPIDT